MQYCPIHFSFYSETDPSRRFSFLIYAMRQLHPLLSSFFLHLWYSYKPLLLFQTFCSTPVYWLSAGSCFRSFPEPFPLPTPLLLNSVQLLCRGQQSVTLWQVVYPPISYLSVCILTGCPPDDCICSPVFTLQISFFYSLTNTSHNILF